MGASTKAILVKAVFDPESEITANYTASRPDIPVPDTKHDPEHGHINVDAHLATAGWLSGYGSRYMATFTRRPPDGQRTHFGVERFASAEVRDEVVHEFGQVAGECGRQELGEPNPARMHDVMAQRDSGPDQSRLGSISVPTGIADAVEAGLTARGHTVLHA